MIIQSVYIILYYIISVILSYAMLSHRIISYHILSYIILPCDMTFITTLSYIASLNCGLSPPLTAHPPPTSTKQL